MIKNLYIFSGLGADERVFQQLDFSCFRPTFIKWINPQHSETIEHYASRLLKQINTENPILIGLSFGGLMAIEVAKQIDTEKVIIISSVKTKKEIPFYFRLAGFLKLYTILPTRLLKSSNSITYWFFGARSKHDKELLKQILKDTDLFFLKWAIEKVACWRNQIKIKDLIHIHGTNDKILPSNFVNCNYEVKNGGHFMVLDRANEITDFLKTTLSQ